MEQNLDDTIFEILKGICIVNRSFARKISIIFGVNNLFKENFVIVNESKITPPSGFGFFDTESEKVYVVKYTEFSKRFIKFLNSSPDYSRGDSCFSLNFICLANFEMIISMSEEEKENFVYKNI